MKKKNIIISVILAFIILVGIIITAVWGLNFGLEYSTHQELDILIGKEFENKEVEAIVEEVIGNSNFVVRKVELYEDMVTIILKEVTDEQKEALNTKINEKYEVANKVEDMVITQVPNARGRDLVKPYILPVVISLVIILIYLVVYTLVCNHFGKNISLLKTLVIAIISIIGVQLLYLSLLAITRLPINALTIPIAIILYTITTIANMCYLEKQN